MFTITINNPADALIASKVLGYYAELMGGTAATVSVEEQEADVAMLVAERGAAPEVSEESAQTSDKPKRTRRTKAEMEAVRAAEASASQVDPGVAFTGPIDEPIMLDTPEEPADLYSQLVSNDVTPVTPPVDRDALIEQARTRAKASVAGGQWLVAHVLCGSKFANLSAVPDHVLVTALSLPELEVAA